MPSSPATAPIPDARIAEILSELNASGSGLQSLDELVARSEIETDRIIVGPDITYARLVGEATDGGPVVILHFEGMWERATKSAPLPPERAMMQAVTVPRVAAGPNATTRARKRVSTAASADCPDQRHVVAVPIRMRPRESGAARR